MPLNPHRRAALLGRSCWAALGLVLLLGPAAKAAEKWTAMIDPDNSLSFNFLHGERTAFHMGVIGWGPKWAWVGVGARDKAQGERLSVRTPFAVNKDQGEVIDLGFEAWQPGAKQVA